MILSGKSTWCGNRVIASAEERGKAIDEYGRVTAKRGRSTAVIGESEVIYLKRDDDESITACGSGCEDA
jgi:hypothetical protein